jgi:rod shape-determining protein MreC
VRRPRLSPELALIAACIALYLGAAAQVRVGEGSVLAAAVSTLSTPIVSTVNAAGRLWSDLWVGREDIRAVLAEHARLRVEVGELRRTNQLLASEVAQLREGSRLLAALPSLTTHAVLARVVARDVFGTNTLRLDAGSRAGVLVDSPVIAEGGVVGRVDLVTSSTSRVQLLTHPAAAAAARVVGVDAEALLVGGESPKLTSLPPFTTVAADRPVVTTGSEGIYPPGLLLGTTVVARNEGLFTVVDVRLAVRPAEVTVVLIAPPSGGAP